ncbi:MAG: DUF6279 family lipoprotein [Gammaproteobacteria bacterium]|nr:DUF6279 family lipoprotein [Gammaproteobacteria bacterium]
MFRTAVAAILTGCLLAGCSATSLVYDNLPWLLRQRIDARLDLTSTQSSLLKTHIAEFAAWHRREELPRYAMALERLEQAIGDGLTGAELEEFTALFKEARRRLLSRAVPLSAEFLLTVTSAQITKFEQTHREAMDEDGERLELSPEEQAEVRYARTLDNLEDWFGDFDKTQSERIRQLLDALPDTYPSWLQRREYRHRRIVELLQNHPTRAQLEDSLRRWWLSDTADLPPQMRTDREVFWRSANTFMLEVDGLITEQQRLHATRKLRGYREDFVRLSKAVPVAPRANSRS